MGDEAATVSTGQSSARATYQLWRQGELAKKVRASAAERKSFERRRGCVGAEEDGGGCFVERELVS